MPTCAADKRQSDGAALGKMRDRVYLMSAANFKKDKARIVDEKDKDRYRAPVFERFKRGRVVPAVPRPRSQATMTRPPPLCSPAVQSHSGYRTKPKFSCAGFTSAARGFVSTAKEYFKDTPVPAMRQLPPAKDHLSSTALAWANPDKLAINKLPQGCPWARPATTTTMRRSAGGTATKYEGSNRRLSLPGSQTPLNQGGSRRASLQGLRGCTAKPIKEQLVEQAQDAAKHLMKHDGWGYFNKLSRLKKLPQTNKQCTQFLQHFLAKKGESFFPDKDPWTNPGEQRAELDAIVLAAQARLNAERFLESKPSTEQYELHKTSEVEGLCGQMVDL